MEKQMIDINIKSNLEIEKAIEFAQYFHQKETRKYSNSNSVLLPYIFHPMQVANKVWAWGGTLDMVCAAILHDVWENVDKKIREKVIEETRLYFNGNVCNFVEELTLFEDNESKEECLNKFMTVKSVQSLIVKAVDRICNINDFAMHDGEYAVQYYIKGIVLFDAVEARKDEIIQVLSEETYKKATRAIDVVNHMVNYPVRESEYLG